MSVIEFPAVSRPSHRPAFTVPEFAKTGADPICAAILKHHAAYAACLSASNDYEQSAKGDRETATLIALMETRPITAHGCAALLRYLSDYQREEGIAMMFSDFGEPLKSLGANVLDGIAEALEGQIS